MTPTASRRPTPAAAARPSPPGPPRPGRPTSVPLGLATTLLLALAACHPYVQGNGVFHEESRDLPAFAGVVVADGVLATVRAGDAQSVRVSGDENVVVQVETRVRTDDGWAIPVLDVSVSGGGYRSVHPLRVDVALPALRLVRVGPETQLEATDVASDALAVVASDGGVVGVAGSGGASLEVSLSGGQHGGARLDARGYPVATAAVTLTGGSIAQLAASSAVSGTAAQGCRVENVGAGACQVIDGAGQPVSCTPP